MVTLELIEEAFGSNSIAAMLPPNDQEVRTLGNGDSIQEEQEVPNEFPSFSSEPEDAVLELNMDMSYVEILTEVPCLHQSCSSEKCLNLRYLSPCSSVARKSMSCGPQIVLACSALGGGGRSRRSLVSQ